MNIRKKLTAAATGAFGLAFASSAFAQTTPVTTIYIAGANGDRATINTTIQSLLAEGSSSYKVGVNATATSSNYVVYEGTFNGQLVKVKASYIGATGGIYGVAGQQTIRFLPDSYAYGTFGASVLDPTVGSNANEAVIPDIAVSSSSQANSPFVGDYQGITYDTTLVDQLIAVLPLTWVASPGFTGTNITTQQAKLIFTTGRAPLSVFTGQNADRNKTVFATGRNLDAGQRIVAQQEIGIGWATFVKQYKPTSSGGTGGYDQTVNSHELWPIDPNNYSGGSSVEIGNGGQDTGANLSKILSSTLSTNAYTLGGTSAAVAGWYVSYLTPNDAKAIINGANTYNGHRAVPLAYNGVTIWSGDLATGNWNFEPIKEGQYSFWTYERIYYKQNLASQSNGVLKKQFADAIVNAVRNTINLTPLGSVKFSDVAVERSGEGELVAPNYNF